MNDKKSRISFGSYKKLLPIAAIAIVVGIGVLYEYHFSFESFEQLLGLKSQNDFAVSDMNISTSADVLSPTADSPSEYDTASNSDSDSNSNAASNPVQSSPVFSSAADNSDNSTNGISLPILQSSSSSSQSSIAPASNDAAIVASSSCSFPQSASPASSRKIMFNEIAWMGSASSSNAEWIEIKNITNADIPLNGWLLRNNSGKISVTFSGDQAIVGGGLLVLLRDSAGGGISYSGSLSNAGDQLVIMDAQCNVSDFLDASSGWPAGNNTTKQTLERDADENGWHTSVPPGGTPGEENSIIVPLPNNDVSSTPNTISNPAQTMGSSTEIIAGSNTSSTTPSSTTTESSSSSGQSDPTSLTTPPNAQFTHILITAVQIAGASSSNDLIKLYNPTSGAIDVSGWKLHKRSATGTDYSIKTFPSDSVLAPGAYFVWANSGGGFSETVNANVSSTETLSADNSIALFDTNGVIVDALAWGTGESQYSEGPPYPTDPIAGQTLVRQSANGAVVDTENNANDFTLQ